MATYLLVLVLCAHLVFAQRTISPEEQWCIEKRDQYGIQPGKSFGTLPENMHNEYLAARCYRFFCKPHPRAGKGVFDCEPLEPKSS
jgi:hypothetical protein